MPTEQIQFEDTDKYLTATIDNQTLDLSVKRIVKTETVITLLNAVDTALNNNINIKASLKANNTPIMKGNVLISILDDNMHIIYQHIVSVSQGNIIDTINNNLKLGKYYLKIEYFGSQFYLPCEYITSFTINKRYVGYKLYTDNIHGYPNDVIDFRIKLFDFYTHQPLSCNIQYSINDISYLTSTNEDGIGILHITIPDVDESKCNIYLSESDTNDEIIIGYKEEEYYNDDGNLRTLKSFTTDIATSIDMDHKGYIYNEEEEILWFDQAYYQDIPENYQSEYNPDFIINSNNTSTTTTQYGYPVVISIIDDTYYREDIIQYIYAEKISTQIGTSSIKNNNNHVIIEGNMFSEYDIKYGTVSLIINGNSLVSHNIDKNGHFILEWDVNNILGNESNNITNNEDYTYALNQRNININIVQDENNEYKVNNTMRTTAYIRTQGDNKVITDGMVYFTIHDVNKNNQEIYRFPTELNNDGEAILLFDISTVGKYYVQAHYCGMFEYLDADSNIEKYTITK